MGVPQKKKKKKKVSAKKQNKKTNFSLLFKVVDQSPQEPF